MRERLTGYWNTLRAHLRADPRKTIALGVLSLVMCGVWGRLLMRPKRPAPIGAAQLSSELVAATVVRVGDRPADVTPPPRSVEIRSVFGGAAVDIHDASRTLARDPFAVDSSLFAVDAAEPESAAARTPKRSWWAEIRDTARQERERQRRRAAQVEEAATAIKLQSTIAGAEPAAMLSGKLVHVGERVNGFELIEVRDRQAVVRKDGVRVTLTLPP
ncbi:MAG: hypothetical protein U1A27_08740 [Phycisphaerae bacterium]